MSNETTETTEETTADAEPEGASEYTRLEAAHYQAIREAERGVAELAVKAEATKSKASAAKKNFEAAVEELRELIRRGPGEQKTLPGCDGAEDAWRHMPLTAMGIDGALLDNLVEVDIKTIGDLSDQTDKYGVTWHNTIAGVGDVAAEKVADLFIEFWKEHPEFCDATKVDEESEDE